MTTLRLSINSQMQNIPNVENFIEKLISTFQLTEEMHGKMRLATIEAVNNSILHGNKQNPEKKIQITALKNDHILSITIEDEGEGFNHIDIPDPTNPENVSQTSGRGLYIITHLADQVVWEKDGARIIMLFFLPGYSGNSDRQS